MYCPTYGIDTLWWFLELADRFATRNWLFDVFEDYTLTIGFSAKIESVEPLDWGFYTLATDLSLDIYAYHSDVQ